MSEHLHIALSCDENYIPYATTVMLSCMQNAPGESIQFHLIDCGITAESQQKAKNLVAKYDCNLSIITPNRSDFSGLPTLRYSEATYHRINLPEYLSHEIDRVIYLDSDLIVLGNISELWHADLKGAPIGAVENLSPKASTGIQFARQDYFNAGVLVFDLRQWRDQALHKQVIEFAKNNVDRLKHLDQCSLNGVLQGNWAHLPLKWNQQSDVYKVILKYYEGCGYSRSEMNTAMLEPAIVHFTGKKKPWKRYCFHPFKTYYRKVLNQTPWAGLPYPDDDLETRLRYIFALRSHWKFHKRHNVLPECYRRK